ncbi:hypothetical protein SKAU_G00295470 [Synaphobranchus kaupii]|uniref:Uncharacterized protein n=1 Tax=Synaphobranchus kaupii TaxID=118154 RepID=A0A9Q1EUL6_SYNKA|nr:hypothetical protein SKAU_G00295470 [Synaphobranchus kaupii]
MASSWEQLTLIIIYVQGAGCTVLEHKEFTSCENLRIPGGFKYSYEIPEVLQSEDWNSSRVLAYRQIGTDWMSSSEERWIHFIVKDAGNVTEKPSPTVTAVCIIIPLLFLSGIGLLFIWKMKWITFGRPCDRGAVQYTSGRAEPV